MFLMHSINKSPISIPVLYYCYQPNVCVVVNIRPTAFIITTIITGTLTKATLELQDIPGNG